MPELEPSRAENGKEKLKANFLKALPGTNCSAEITITAQTIS